LLIKGRVNYLNLSRYSKLSERTYRRQFHKGFHFVQFNKGAIEKVIPISATQIFAQDASFLKKSGKQTDGIDWFFNGCAGRPEKGLEISLISVIDLDANRGYALSVKQTKTTELSSEPTKSKLNQQNSPKGKTKGKEGLPEKTIIDFYLQHLRETRPYLPKALKCGAFDGFYAKQKFIDGVCALELTAISRLRIDANMRYLYTGAYKGHGRPKTYDGKVRIEDLHRLDCIGQIEPNLFLYTAVVYHVTLKRKIRLALLVNIEHKTKPRFALLFSTDIEMSALDIYRFYKARFQIEFIFRDAKQFTGLADCQARDSKALDFHFNASLSALNLAKIETWLQRDTLKPFVFSLATYKQLAFNQHFLDFIFSNFRH
jgi:Transposase DDE domain.